MMTQGKEIKGTLSKDRQPEILHIHLWSEATAIEEKKVIQHRVTYPQTKSLEMQYFFYPNHKKKNPEFKMELNILPPNSLDELADVSLGDDDNGTLK